MDKKKPLLIIEDDPVQQAILERYLEGQPFQLTLASNAEMAMSVYASIRHRVVICDIHLPGGVSGAEVLKRLMQYENPPVVVMLTADSDARQIIECMRAGAYDYIIKPAEPADLKEILWRAFDRAQSEQTLRVAEKERLKLMKKQLTTRRIADLLIRRHNDNFVQGIFRNLHASFSQGKGVGAVSTLISMLEGSAKSPDGKTYQIPVDILDMVFDNQKTIVEMLQVFLDLQLLVSKEPTVDVMMLVDFHTLIAEEIAKLSPLVGLAGHRVILTELNPRFSSAEIQINREFMQKAIRELIINALKFSTPGSTISILLEYLYTRTMVTILSVPLPGESHESGVIPEDYRTVIFEPFFRLSRVVREQYGTLEFGLGLTLVEKVIQFHQGKIRCMSMEVFESGEDGPVDMVGFEIELPT
jgi:DNA-binding response OmpR family regulator